MNQEMKIFENSAFGKVRVQMVNEVPMFAGKDVATVLGYKDTINALKYHVDCDDKIIVQLSDFQYGGKILPPHMKGSKITLINESGVYSLIFGSKLPTAKAFKKWVTSEVLPSIRKTLTTLESITYSGNIDGIVYSKDGKPTTTSRIIANVFNRNHKDILEAIDNKVNSKNASTIDFLTMNIRQTMYLSENGKTYREYELTEDGFSFIVLGFTGEKIDECKIRYIEAFGKMRGSIINMFKAKILDDVLPQSNKLRRYVYAIKNPYSELIKIGVARDVDARLKQLQTGAGIELELVYKSMLCSNAFKIENIAHDKFKNKRKFGEWFEINPQEAISFIEKQEFTLNSQFNILYKPIK